MRFTVWVIIALVSSCSHGGGTDADVAEDGGETSDADVEGNDGDRDVEVDSDTGCTPRCSALRCGVDDGCQGTCGPVEPMEMVVSEPIDTMMTHENMLHMKQDKIVVTSDGTIHLMWSSWLEDGGVGYARSYDGGETWEAQQYLDDEGWIGSMVVGPNDTIYMLYAASGPKARIASVDKSSSPWSWTWGERSVIEGEVGGFLGLAIDSTGIAHVVASRSSAFSFHNPTGPVDVGVYYFRATAPYDLASIELVEALSEMAYDPIFFPDITLAYAPDGAIGVDGDDNVIIAYSDRALFQAGEREDIWPDSDFSAHLSYRRYTRTSDGWNPEEEEDLASGAYGDVDLVMGPDSTTHLVYTRLDSGSDYRAVYRQVSPTGVVGDEVLLSNGDLGTTERTIFPSISLFSDGMIAVVFTDRLTHPEGLISAVFRRPMSDSFTCVHHLTGQGNINGNVYRTDYDGSLLVGFMESGPTIPGQDRDNLFQRFGRIDAP